MVYPSLGILCMLMILPADNSKYLYNNNIIEKAYNTACELKVQVLTQTCQILPITLFNLRLENKLLTVLTSIKFTLSQWETLC